MLSLGIGMGLSFLIGLAYGAAGGTDPGGLAFMLLFDLAAIVVLIIMGVRGYNPAAGLKKQAGQTYPAVGGEEARSGY